jgi:hypothetical protein
MAAGIVEAGRDDAGMDEAVLLREGRRIRHRKLDLAGLQPRDRNAERAHRGLRVEHGGGGATEVRIFRLKARHHAIAGSDEARYFAAISRVAGGNGIDLCASRSR